jgi:hypothetical protein
MGTKRVKARHIDFYADDWIAGNVGLRMEERGVLWSACALIYSRGGPIERAHLRQICPGDARVFNRALKGLIERGKLVEEGGLLSNNRCVSELERSHKRIAWGAEAQRNSDLDDNEVNGLGNGPSRARATPPSAKHTAKADGSDSLPPARGRPLEAAPPARGNDAAKRTHHANGHDRPTRTPPPLPPDQQAMFDEINANKGRH